MKGAVRQPVASESATAAGKDAPPFPDLTGLSSSLLELLLEPLDPGDLATALTWLFPGLPAALAAELLTDASDPHPRAGSAPAAPLTSPATSEPVTPAVAAPAVASPAAAATDESLQTVTAPGGEVAAAPPAAPAPPESSASSPIASGPAEAAAQPSPKTSPGPIPSTGAALRQRVDAAASTVSHPAIGDPAQARAPLDKKAAAIRSRAAASMDAAAATPAQLAGRLPAGRPPPAPDPGPIPKQLAALRALTGGRLDPVVLPLPAASPLGTVPNPAGTVLSDEDLRTLRIGETAIALVGSGTDAEREQVEHQQKLQAEYDKLKPKVPQGPEPAAEPLPLLVDEPELPGVHLTEGQRAMFTQVAKRIETEQTEQAKLVLAAIRHDHPAYPGDVLRLVPGLGDTLIPSLAGNLTAQATQLSAALTEAPDRVDAVLQDRRREAEQRRLAAATATARATSEATAQARRADARTRSAVRSVASATTRAAAGVRGRPLRLSRTELRVERAIAELQDPVALELARLDEQLRARKAALKAGIRRQIAAIGLAQARDELTLTTGRPVDSAPEPRLDTVTQWASTTAAQQQAALPELEEAAQVATDALKTALKASAADAMQALRAWGAAHTRAGDTWWQERDAELTRWATDAGAQAEFWAREQEQASRLALLADLSAVVQYGELLQEKNTKQAEAFVAGLDDEARAVVGAIQPDASGGVDFAGALVAGLRERVHAERQTEIESRLAAEVLALDTSDEAIYKQLTAVLAETEPTTRLDDRAHEIREATHRWRGHDEDEIFKQLEGLSPLAARLLAAYYRRTYDRTLEQDLRYTNYGWLNEDEMRTARGLLAGSRVDAAAGTIRTAIAGAGSNITAVNRALRALTGQERSGVRQAYRDRYDNDDLDADLGSQWSLSAPKVAETVALLDNDLTKADAIAFAATVRMVPGGGYGEGAPPEPPTWTIDLESAEQVLARNRAAAEEEGSRRRWTSAQVAASAVARTQAMLGRVDVLSADAAWAAGRAPGMTASQAALDLAGARGGDLLRAVASGDRTAERVARIRIEDAGAWASDSVLLGVLEDVETRSRADVERDLGPVLAARRAARLRGLSGEALVDERLRLQHEDERRIDALVKPVTAGAMTALGTLYQQVAHRSLDTMVDANMSGVDADEATARIKGGGVLTPTQEITFATGGFWSADKDRLRRVVGRMGRAEITTLESSAEWQQQFGRRSVADVVKANSSGRDRGDLVYMAEKGRPTTARMQVDAVLERLGRDRAMETRLGRLFSGTERRIADRDAADLVAAYQDLRVGSTDPAAAKRAEVLFGVAVERSEASIERRRKAIDSASDLLANIASVVAAVVIGVALAPFTGGASAVVAAAVIGSIGATATSMIVKSLVKGGAYGDDEFKTDLAIGAIDAVVSGLTAGLGKALLGPMKAPLTGKTSILFRALMRLGPAGRAAARAQMGTLAFLGRFGAQGVLARALERRALLEGLAKSDKWLLQKLATWSAHLIESGIQAVPTSLAGAVLDRDTRRAGPGAVLKATAEGTAHSVAMAVGIGAATHGLGALIGAVAERRLPLPDVSTPHGRLAAFREWRVLEQPGGSLREFHEVLSLRRAAESARATATHATAREARRALLSGLPPIERGRYAGLPVVTLPEAYFTRPPTGEAPPAGEARSAGEVRPEGTQAAPTSPAAPASPAAGGHDARLVVGQNGRAVIVLREGASPAAAATLLPEVRLKVLARTGGLTVAGALPASLRDVPAFRHPDLTGDEVRVVPQFTVEGRLTGVELHVGPEAHPADVALHADELRRWRAWTGLLGSARRGIAEISRMAGRDVVTPDPSTRHRFEAAGELVKLEPLARERVRRYAVVAAAGDTRAVERLRRQVGHLLAQLEHARRIATGAVHAAPKGYVAMADTLGAPPQGEHAVREIRRLREAHRSAEEQIAHHERQIAATLDQVELRRKDLETVFQRLIDKPGNERLAALELDEIEFARRVEKRLGTARVEAAEAAYRMRREGLKLAAGPDPRLPAPDVQDLVGAHRALQAEQLKAEAVLRRNRAAVEVRKAEQTKLQAAIGQWQGSKHVKIHAEVLVSPALAGHEPIGGWRLEPRPLLEEGTHLQRLSHQHGEKTEIHLANFVAETLGESLVKWGAPLGTAGKLADLISVKADGSLTFWDAKFESGGGAVYTSETFTKRLDRVKAEARRLLSDSMVPGLTEKARQKALANLDQGIFQTKVVTSKELGVFHHVQIEVHSGSGVSAVIREKVNWRLP